jgi:hypothetical protein
MTGHENSELQLKPWTGGIAACFQLESHVIAGSLILQIHIVLFNCWSGRSHLSAGLEELCESNQIVAGVLEPDLTEYILIWATNAAAMIKNKMFLLGNSCHAPGSPKRSFPVMLQIDRVASGPLLRMEFSSPTRFMNDVIPKELNHPNFTSALHSGQRSEHDSMLCDVILGLFPTSISHKSANSDLLSWGIWYIRWFASRIRLPSRPHNRISLVNGKNTSVVMSLHMFRYRDSQFIIHEFRNTFASRTSTYGSHWIPSANRSHLNAGLRFSSVIIFLKSWSMRFSSRMRIGSVNFSSRS